MDYWDGWARNGPPAYIVIAAQAGFKPAEETKKDRDFTDMVRELARGR